MPGSIVVARLIGIDIRIHLSWFLIFGLILLTLADRVLPALRPNWSDTKTVVVAAITAVLFFVSIVLHELAHALVARVYRMPVSSITLFLLGGVANLAKEPPSAKAELLMAGAGPLTSLALGGAGIGLALVIDQQLRFVPVLDPVGVVASYLGVINVSLAVFNMIPGFPLDGGRVLRAIVWGLRRDRRIATTIAARGGQLVAALLMGWGVFQMVTENDAFSGVWAALIAYFLYNAASSAIVQERVTAALGSVKVETLMRTEPRSVLPTSTVAALVNEIVMPHNLRAVPVVDFERMLGLVTIADLRKVDRARWPTTLVREVMRPLEGLATVTPDDTLVTALERFGVEELPTLPVVRDRKLAGLLDREAILGYLRMRETLGMR